MNLRTGRSVLVNMRMVRVVFLLALAAVAAPSLAQDDLAFVLGEKDAVGTLAPVVASDAMVQQMEWSRDGQYLVVTRLAQPNGVLIEMLQKGPQEGNMARPAIEIVVFSTRTGKSTVAVRSGTESPIRAIGMAGDRLFYLENRLGTAENTPLMQVSAVIPGQRPTPLLQGSNLWNADVSPSGKLVAVAVDDAKVVIFDANARIVREVSREPGTGFNGWISDKELSLIRRVGNTAQVVAADIATGTIRTDFERVGETPSSGLHTFAATERRDARPVTSVWIAMAGREKEVLDGERVGTALVTGDGDMPMISPGRKWLAYRTNGIALVRPIVSIDREMYLAMRRAARQTQAMSNAKQAALALIMYASDNDDNVVAGADWQSKLMPYLKNGDILNGFTLLLDGGSFSKIADPSKTPMGFIELPWGRAMAYADGHVRWIPNP